MNKVSKGFHLLALLMLWMISSCSDENPWSGSSTEGGIRMSFSVDAEVECMTRAADNESPLTPDERDFKIKLEKTDGSYSHEWENLEAFHKESGFPIGDYKITAYYGDIDTEGIRAPYYIGEAAVHVSPGAVTETKVTAALANSMVSVRYTDDFKSMFSSYSSSLTTTGHSPVIMEGSEIRPAYVSPTEVTLNLRLANSDGKEVTVTPLVFPALVRHHHIVTFGINPGSETGNATLEVTFDDEVATEDVSISLGEDLFSAPAPEIQSKGFDLQDGIIKSYEYAVFGKQAQFDVIAFAGIGSAVFEISSDNGYSPAFGKSVDLVKADEVVKAQLAAAGLECSGFYKGDTENRKMGVVNLAGFISKLPKGNYTVRLQATDLMTRAAEPVSLNVEISEVGIEIKCTHKPEFFGNTIQVDVATDCPEIKDAMSFMVSNSRGQMVEAKVIKVSDVLGDIGVSYQNIYRYDLNVPEILTGTLKVESTLGKRQFDMEVPVKAPVIMITPDAFAHKVILKIEGDSDEHTKYICDNIDIYDGSTLVPNANIKVVDNGFISISGLQAGKNYAGLNVRLDSYNETVPHFTTEEETALTNGDFSALHNTINTDWVNAGGQYKYGANTMQNKSKISIDEPEGWASTNAKTCYLNSTNKNTWFMVPSVLWDASRNMVLVRSVAYDHNGTSPKLDDHGLSVRKKYSRNAPESFAHMESGELFLGSYSFAEGTESRADGVDFTSRPVTVSFDYEYVPYKMDKGVVAVSVIDDTGKFIASETVDLNESANSSREIVKLKYSLSDFGKKARKIVISFKSSRGENVEVDIPAGDRLEDVTDKYSLDGQEIATNKYKSLSIGSSLWVGNVQLGYVE